MKKLFYLFILLQLTTSFSNTLNSNDGDITGIWFDDKDVGGYYVVILNNVEEGYQFVNFSFFEQDTVTETLLEDDGNVVWTKINNPDNDWYVICAYSYVDKNTLKVIYEGEYNGTDYLKRKVITHN
jgi:hypothetical protein